MSRTYAVGRIDDSNCRKCGFKLAIRSTVCENCGTVISLEEARNSTPAIFLQAFFGKNILEFPVSKMALFLAFIPMLYGPPLVSIAICVYNIVRRPERISNRKWQLPIIIGIVNIVISILLWRHAAGILLDQFQEFRFLFSPSSRSPNLLQI
jgi:hypothetical protein